MAETTPTPAPQDAATSAPQQDLTTQGPDQGSAPAQAAPTAAPMPANQSDQTAAAPTASSTAPSAGATAAPKILPKRGLMSSVLMGALRGADDAMKTAGKAAVTVAKNTQTGQRIQDQILARKAKEQEMKQSARQAADTHQISLDTHTENMLRANTISMSNIHQAAVNAQEESLFPTKSAEEREALMGQLRTKNDAQIKQLVQLEESGVHIDKSHFTEGNPFDQLTPDHSKAIANGVQIALSNGLTGKDADLGFVSVAELANTPLQHDFNTVTDWNLDPKTGKMIPVYSTLKAGDNTALDAVIAHDVGMDRFNTKQDMYTKQVESQQKAALAEQQGAMAQLDAEQAKQLANMGVQVPQGFTPDPTSFNKTMPQLQQTLQAAGVKTPGDFANLYAIGHYDADLKSLPSRNYKGAPGTTQDQGNTFIRTFINPNYDVANFTAVQNMKKEFADTRPNTAGGNLMAFNAATGHLGQLYQAAFAMNNGNIQALNEIANRIGVATGQSAPVVYDGIRNVLVGELGKTFKGAAADIPEADRIIATLSNAQGPQQMQDLAKTYAHAMLTKEGSVVAHFYAYTGYLPPQTIDPISRQVYQQMGIDPNSVLPSGATSPVGSTGNQNPSSNQNVVPQGKKPVYSKKTGQIAGYADDDKLTNYTPF